MVSRPVDLESPLCDCSLRVSCESWIEDNGAPRGVWLAPADDSLQFRSDAVESVLLP